MKCGVPPTALNARTGELTPPGMSFFARSNSFADCADSSRVSLISGVPSPSPTCLLRAAEDATRPRAGVLAFVEHDAGR